MEITTSSGSGQIARHAVKSFADVGPTSEPLDENGDGSGTGGYLVVCNDGDNADAPQGPIYGEGNATTGGAVCADGDADYPPDAQGWACVGVTDSGPFVECSDIDGGDTSNSENRDHADQPENCG